MERVIIATTFEDWADEGLAKNSWAAVIRDLQKQTKTKLEAKLKAVGREVQNSANTTKENMALSLKAYAQETAEKAMVPAPK